MDWDKQNQVNAELQARRVRALYAKLITSVSVVAANLSDLDPDKLFEFNDHARVKSKIDKLLSDFAKSVEVAVIDGAKASWTLSNNKNSELTKRLFGKQLYRLTEEQRKAYFSRSVEARDAFLRRKTAGLTISERVWNYAPSFKTEMEAAIDAGIVNGRPARDLASDIKKYLREPDRLYRRVRDKHGVLGLSKAAKVFHPGVGVYRSSQKNAERLTRTEMNESYREADFVQWAKFDFVLGYEVFRSSTLFLCPLCDALVGKYPKEYKFMGRHPHCRCKAVPILVKQEELFLKRNPQERVKEAPQMDSWIGSNKERLKKAQERGTMPLFVSEYLKYKGATSL